MKKVFVDLSVFGESKKAVSTEIQKRLFALGYRWMSGNNTEVLDYDIYCLGIGGSKHISFIDMSGDGTSRKLKAYGGYEELSVDAFFKALREEKEVVPVFRAVKAIEYMIRMGYDYPMIRRQTAWLDKWDGKSRKAMEADGYICRDEWCE